MRKKLSVRVMLPTVITVIVSMVIFGFVTTHSLNSEVQQRADSEVDGQTDRLLDTLQSVNELSLARVHGAMNEFKAEGERLGPVAASGQTTVGSESIPVLYLGNQPQVGNFQLVDRIQVLSQSSATLFVKRGDAFIRVSTNVKKADGSRAIGTALDAKGKAYAAIKEGRAFYGVVDILGTQYMTGYEPMRAKSGEVVGIWFVGYPLSALGEMGKRMAEIKILEHGFVALLDAKGKVLFKPENISEEQIKQLQEPGGNSGWTVASKPFNEWKFTLLAAYPRADVERRLHELQLLVVLCAVIMTVFLGAIQYAILSRLVLKPVQELIHRMENADLNTSLREEREDEIGVLASTFDTFVSGIRKALIQVAKTSDHLASASEEISSSAREQAQAAEEQTSQTDQVATSMGEMSSTVNQVSENTSQAAKAAEQTAETARKGGTVVESSVAKMRAIAGSVSATATKMQELGKRSDQIGHIIGVIDDIADQTNLLALNAAIEAARAGEQGRGFAVVADEVRKLAERTTTATKEIGEMIKSIQKETKNAVEAMHQGTSQVEEGVETAALAGASLEQIIQMAENVGQMITQIATATTEQTSTTENVKGNIGEIAKLIKESAAGAQQSAQACQDLSSLALDLRKLVDGFKLDMGDQDSEPEKYRSSNVGNQRSRTYAAAAGSGM